MAKKDSGGVDRRAFLAGIGAASAGAASAAAAGAAPTPVEAKPTTLPPVSQSYATTIAQIENAPPSNNGPGADALHITNPGSDYMVDVMIALGYKYVAATPGTTFRGLQESVITYAQGKMEWLSCTHEEISGSMAHGYYKASGKPMAIMVHNTVGLQHATMAMYNCWADRVPMLVMLGNYADGDLRSGAADWDHSMVDNAAMCRGYIKYDEQPGSLNHYKESMQRGHGLMMTAPRGPIIMTCEQTLQEDTQSRKPQPALTAYVAPTQPAPDPGAMRKIAQMLVAAKNPLIVADHATDSQASVKALVALAEALQVPVADRLGRMNFPTNHYLCGSGGMAANADLILALDPSDLSGIVERLPDTIARVTAKTIRPDCKVISIDSQLLASGGNFQDKQRFYQADFPVAADSATTLPYLLEAVNSAMTPARRAENAQREAAMREAYYLKRSTDMQWAAVGWDSVPISVARMCMEIWNKIKNEQWALVSPTGFQSNWPLRLWDFTDYNQYHGGSGAAGIGYIGGAAVGAALGHKDGDKRLCISIQGDGDFLMGPGAMWTAAHHRIPLLMIIHNNRAWYQETMAVQLMGGRRDRHPDRGRIGTEIVDPNINYAKIAEGFGVHAEPQITQPGEIGPALARALKVVKSGYPALLDIVTQGR